MANQQNYVEPIQSLQNGRPFRLSYFDRDRSRLRDGSVLFGTSTRDNVEVWFYSTSGVLLSGVKLNADDPAVSLATHIDTTGAEEYVRLDMDEIISRTELPPGRYITTVNFFSDEVGSLDGYKLEIEKISSDRTEVLVSPIDINSQTRNDTYEFVTPSVTKLYAQALIDQLFGKNLDIVEGEQFNLDNMMSRMDQYVTDFSSRVEKSLAVSPLEGLIHDVIEEAYSTAISNILNDSENRVVQQSELEGYIDNAINSAMDTLEDRKFVDARFKLT